MAVRNREVLKAHLAILGANFIYGLNYVIAKGIMPEYMTPRAIIMLRVVGAAIIFWLVTAFTGSDKVTRADLLKLFLLSFLGIAVNQIMFFEGLNLTTPINASIIMVGVPIAVLVFSHFLLKEKLNTQKIIGIVLGSAGALWLILRNGQLSFTSGTFLGNVFMVVNVTSYAAFLVLVKPLMYKYSPLTIMKWVFTFGIIYVVPVSAGQLAQTDFARIPADIWFSIAYVVIFTTVFAYLLNNYSLKTVSPVVNSAYIYLQPFLATVISLIFGKDVLTATEIIAAILIFSGVYLISRSKTVKN
jgi:drug/metabolite transporter (DMT)-like permease